MNKIVEVIKSHNKYTYDYILDMYSKTNDTDLLFYCKVKSNKWEIPDIMFETKRTYEEAFLFIFNIQRVLDNQPKVYSYEDMYCEIDSMIKDNDFDEDDNEFFDF